MTRDFSAEVEVLLSGPSPEEARRLWDLHYRDCRACASEMGDSPGFDVAALCPEGRGLVNAGFEQRPLTSQLLDDSGPLTMGWRHRQ